MAEYRLEPDAEISTTGTNGEEIRMKFNEKGIHRAADDFQEKIVVLERLDEVTRVKGT